MGTASTSGRRLAGFLSVLFLASLLGAIPDTGFAGAEESTPDPAASLALFNPNTGEWHIRYADGVVDRFFYGTPGDVPLLGDWDCDGVDTVAMFRPSNGFVYLRNSNTFGVADRDFFYGEGGDVPLAGDWDGDGCDTLSIYRPFQGQVYVSDRLGTFPADYSFFYGIPGDKPFAGDFNGDGITTVGLYRDTTGFVYFRDSLSTGVADFDFFYGVPSDRIVAGDWDGDGDDTIGIFRPSDESFFLSNANVQGFADIEFKFGLPDWLPLAGEVGVPPHPRDSRDCRDFATQIEAQTWFEFYVPLYGDLSHLDDNANGVACESYFGVDTTIPGSTSTSSTSTTTTMPATTSTTTSSTTSTSTSTTTTTPVLTNPGDTVDCEDFGTQAEAQAWFDTYYPHYGDVANLDPDGDLFACDSGACSLTTGPIWQPNEGATDYTLHQRPEGTVRAVMIFVDFQDAPASEATSVLYDMLVPDAQTWITEVSRGSMDLVVDRVDLWFRMPQPSYDYGFGDGLTFDEHIIYMADAVAAADSDTDFSPYTVVYVVAASGAAIPLSPTILPYPGLGIEADGVEVRLAVTFGQDIRIPRENQASMILVHEMGHILGLPDTYLWGMAAPAAVELVGGWDPMSYFHPGGHFSAWHKLKLGWLDDNDVVCLTGPVDTSVSLTALAAPGGTKAVVIKTSESTAYVAEIRRPIGLDQRLCDEGMVIYRIDARVSNGQGPMLVEAAHRGTDPVQRSRCGPIYDAPFDLGPGEVNIFEDAGAGVSFEILSRDGDVNDIAVRAS